MRYHNPPLLLESSSVQYSTGTGTATRRDHTREPTANKQRLTISNCMILIRIFLGGSEPLVTSEDNDDNDFRLKLLQCGQWTCLHGGSLSPSAAAAAASPPHRRQFSKNSSFCRKKTLLESWRDMKGVAPWPTTTPPTTPFPLCSKALEHGW